VDGGALPAEAAGGSDPVSKRMPDPGGIPINPSGGGVAIATARTS
jgi:hypothetical protein